VTAARVAVLVSAGTVWALSGRWGLPALAVAVLWPLMGRLSRQPRGRRVRRVWTEEERRAILERDGWACVQCGATEDLEIDHVVPFSRGGACSVGNAQVLCRPCNVRKGAT